MIALTESITVFCIGTIIMSCGWYQLWWFPIERGAAGFVATVVGFIIEVVGTMMLLRFVT